MSTAAPDLLTLVQTAGARASGASGTSHATFAVGNEACTHRELQQRVESTARGLVANGFRPGDRIAVLLHR